MKIKNKCSFLLASTLVWTASGTISTVNQAVFAQQSSTGATQYQFVPGSRQARVVTPGTFSQSSQSSQYANGQAMTAQPAQSGGMQLRSAMPASSGYPRQTANPSAYASNAARPSAVQAPANRSSAKAYDFIDKISVDGMERSYRVHIPASYDRTKPIPVILAFHGVGMNSLAMLGMSGLNTVSDRRNFVVVYGEGENNRWDDGIKSGANDIAYVEAILQRLPRLVNIDNRRVYACGISNGGYFAQRLACAMADKIAAVGVVASTMTASTPSLATNSRPVPAIFFLGTEDPLLPWGDGRVKGLGNLGEALGLSGLGSIDNPMVRSGGLVTVPEMINFWTTHNGAGASPSTTAMPNLDPRDGTTVKKESYGNNVVLYIIEGGGHTWPGSFELKPIAELCGATSHDINASEIMWDFFQGRSR